MKLLHLLLILLLPGYFAIEGIILYYKVKNQDLAWKQADLETRKIMDYYREFTPEKLNELRREK